LLGNGGSERMSEDELMAIPVRWGQLKNWRSGLVMFSSRMLIDRCLEGEEGLDKEEIDDIYRDLKYFVENHYNEATINEKTLMKLKEWAE